MLASALSRVGAALGLGDGPRGADYLLPVGVSGGVSVLPAQTQIFVASARYGRAWHLVAGACAASALMLLALGAGQPAGSAAGAALLALAFVLPACGAGALAVLARRAEAAHAVAVAQGQVQQGVLVFPNGDVVVRLQGVFADVEATIEAAHLSRAEVERKCAPWPPRLGATPFLVLYHIGADGRTRRLAVSQAELLEPVERIADELSEQHARALQHGLGSSGAF